MNKKITFLLLVFQLFLFLKINAQISSCPEVLDQSNTTGGNASSSGDQWQSFTASKSGSLTKVEFKTNGQSSGTVNFTYKVFSGGGITGALISQGNGNFNTTTSAYFPINFPVNSVNVTANNVYTCEILISTGYNQLSNSFSNTYAEGSSNSANYDLVFNTYITSTNYPIATISKTNNNCFGGTNGSVNLDVSSGTSPYTYMWSNNATTKDISNLAAGTFTFVVKDVNNCQLISSVTISEPNLFPVSATANLTTICQGTSSTLSVANALVLDQNLTTGSATGYWFSGNSGQQTFIAGQTGILKKIRVQTATYGAASGTITAKIYSGSVGSGTLLKSISYSKPANTNSWDDLIFTGTDVTLTAGTSYYIEIGAGPAIDWVYANSNAYANGQAYYGGTARNWDFNFEVHLELDTYTWNPGAMSGSTVVVSPTSTTNYTVTKTNSLGCTTSAMVNVNVNNLNLSITNPGAVCSPSSVNITAPSVTQGSTSGLTYTYWADAAGSISYATPTNTVSGTYFIKGTDALSCFSIKPVVVTVNTIPTLTVTNPSAVCSPSLVDITAPSVTSGSTSGLTYSYWTDESATTSYATPLSTVAGTYYIKGTDAFSCFNVKPVVITVNTSPTAPTTTSATQAFCSIDSKKVADLIATGTGLTWYNAATLGTAYLNSDLLVSGNYYASQTVGLCESDTRLAVSVTVNDPSAPTTTSANQAFCSIDSKKVADLIATGTSLTWYNTATLGTAYPNTELLVSGNYYASQTVGSCQSDTRLEVSVTVYDPSAPTTTSITQSFCSIDSKKVADLSATGTGLTWYNAPTAGTAYANTDLLAIGTYYASQTVGSCQSANRLAISVTVNAPSAPTTTSGTQAFCSIDNKKVADLTATGTGLTWYNAPTAGTAYLNSNLLVSGTYYASQTVGSCQSANRLAVSVTVNDPSAPTTNSITQSFCSIDNMKVSDLTAIGIGLTWYNAPTAGTAYSSNTILASGSYYASQIVASCQSVTRLEVSVNIIDPSAPSTTSSTQSFCSIDNMKVSDLTAIGTGLTWYNAPTAGTAYSNNDLLASGNYYASQTNGLCESDARLTITVVVNNPSAPTTTSTTQSFCSIDNKMITDLSATGSGLTWYNAPTSGTAYANTELLVSGTYYASQTNGLCESDTRLAIEVSINPSPSLTITHPRGVCSGLTVDITTSTITNGSSLGLTYTYFTDAQVNIPYTTPTTSTAGTYYIKATNSEGCFDIKPVNVSINSIILVTVTSQHVFNSQTCDGSLKIVAKGGNLNSSLSTSNPPYKYSINNGGVFTNDSSFVNLCTGNYSIIVKDSLNCSTLIETTLGIKPSQATPNPCNGSTLNPTISSMVPSQGSSCTGKFYVNTVGGKAPYRFNLVNTSSSTNNLVSISNPFFENLCIGNYNLTVIDSLGCNKTIPVEIKLDTTQVTNPCHASQLAITFVSTNSTTLVASNCNGSLKATISGVTNYTYEWSNNLGNNSLTQNNLCPGNYKLTVTSNGCSKTETGTVHIGQIKNPCTGSTLKAAIVYTIPTEKAACTGKIGLNANGGAVPYSYSVKNVGSTNNLPILSSSPNFNDLCAGMYAIEVKDSLGCVKNLIGKIIIDTSVITTNPCLTNNFTVSMNVTNVSEQGKCDGELVATVNGATNFTYTWSNNLGSTNLNQINLCPGTYKLKVTSNGCTIETVGKVGINVPTNPCVNSTLFVALNTTNISAPGLCDGTVAAVAIGGLEPYEFKWNNGNANSYINQLCYDTYRVDVKDAQGCMITATGIVADFEKVNTPTIPLIGYVIPVGETEVDACDGTASAIIYGGIPPYSYLYSNNSTESIAPYLCPGIQSVKITDSKGDSLVLKFIITSPKNTINLKVNNGKNAVDSLYTSVIKNCAFTDYSLIDTAFIKKYNFLGKDSIKAIWEVHYNGQIIEVENNYAIELKAPGKFIFALQLYCPKKLEGNFLTAYDQVYIMEDITGGTSAGITSEKEIGFKLFPNPFNDYIMIVFDNDNLSEVSVTDITGKEILHEYFNEQNIQLDLNHLSSGSYLITVKNNEIKTTRKILKN